MDMEKLFGNCGAIACIAFGGTFISMAATGLLVWAAGALGLCTAFTFLEALLFGSIVSATDPVRHFLQLSFQIPHCHRQSWDSLKGAQPPSLLPRCCCDVLCPYCLQVTVLAVFQKLGADANLFALVLGESLMNDAVAIVLFRSLSTFLHAPVTAAAVLRCVAAFLGIFVSSMAASFPRLLLCLPAWLPGCLAACLPARFMLWCLLRSSDV
jgi:sodium/hydrogen exchanger 8